MNRSGEVEIKAVVFDLFITLTDFELERTRPAKLAELADLIGVDPELLRHAIRSSFTDRATGRMGNFRASLEEITRSLGADLDAETLDGAVRLRMRQQLEMSQPRAGVIETLAGIKATGRAVGILSDCTPELGELWPQLDYAKVIDAKVFSFEEGQRKPAPELYLTMCERLSVSPEACLYIGDGGSHELTGATSVGMTAAMLRTPLSREFSYDAEEAWEGLVIDSIEDVHRLLR